MDPIEERISHPKMEYYRQTYQDSVRWHGMDSVDGKTVLVYCEQGYGDIIQFLRYIPLLQELGCSVILHCPTPLHRLISAQGWSVDVFDKNDPNLPEHDVHALSMELPFLLGKVEPDDEPYLRITLKEDDLPEGYNIGICWESGPSNDARDCPLKYFRKLGELGNLIVLQPEIRREDLIDSADDLHLWGFACNDFLDTAKVINTVDVVVSVDTAILHLAGAMGRHTFGLLHEDCDARWEFNWYRNCHNLKSDNWEQMLDTVAYMIRNSKD
jgi:hypothetical protein